MVIKTIRSKMICYKCGFNAECVRGNHISFGRYTLQALESAWITSRQIETRRRAMTRNVHCGKKIWVRIFSDKAVTVRPTKTRMRSEKRSLKYWVVVHYKMSGVAENIARKAISIATSKMPIRTNSLLLDRNGEPKYNQRNIVYKKQNYRFSFFIFCFVLCFTLN